MSKYVYLMRVPARFEILVRADSLEEAVDKVSDKSLSMFAMDTKNKKMYLGQDDREDQPIQGVLIEAENMESDLRVEIERYCIENGLGSSPDRNDKVLQMEDFFQWMENQINSEERELLFLFAQSMRRKL